VKNGLDANEGAVDTDTDRGALTDCSATLRNANIQVCMAGERVGSCFHSRNSGVGGRVGSHLGICYGRWRDVDSGQFVALRCGVDTVGIDMYGRTGMAGEDGARQDKCSGDVRRFVGGLNSV